MPTQAHRTPPLLEACTRARISAAATGVECCSVHSPLDESTRLVMTRCWMAPVKVALRLPPPLARGRANKRKSAHSRWSLTLHLAERPPRPRQVREAEKCQRKRQRDRACGLKT